MNVIFETPRFRVHISGQAAWLESVESGQWILRGQVPVPVPGDILGADADPSLLRDAVLEFEQVRVGDTNLRAALTGHREAITVQPRAVAARTPQPRTFRQSAPPIRTRSIWTPQPLRPPLAAKPS
jgi:hypothetical protein